MTKPILALLLLFPLPLLAQEDPYLWLEDVEGEKALEWVEKQNAVSKAALTTHPEFQKIYDESLAILNATDRLATGERHGDFVYNFWRDAQHPRGIYRRATFASFLTGEPEWTVLLDVDALAESEKQNWVFKGMGLRYPDYQRGLARLSIGGSDAVVTREFDLPTMKFVADGFTLPEAKGSMGWVDDDTVYVGTDFGEGTLTDSGYPRLVKLWKRGTPLDDATTVFEGRRESVSVGASREHVDGEVLDWVYNNTSFYSDETYLREMGGLTKLDLPATARIHTYYNNLLFIELKQDWKVGDTTFKQGAVITIPLADLKAGKKNFSVFFEPTAHTSLQSLNRTKSYLIVQTMKDVRDQLLRYHFADGKWVSEPIEFEGDGTISTSSLDPHHDQFFVAYTSFLQPTTLFSVDATTLARKTLQQEPARFDGSKYASAQYFAESKDGTKIPYFLVTPKELKRDGTNMTLISAYGGFRSASRPYYLGGIGMNWLDRGGVYVVANIRGGGEYGPRWHEAALRENRHKCFEDLEAVAEDLIAQKVTAPDKLAVRGGSNGGLLVGAAFTRRPDLYKAVVCMVPLLDMKRYNKLLAGASWMAEYGNPDVPGDWAFLKTYSPYHNVFKDKQYPRVLFTTSTRDDRVHPGHARKMVARMIEQGHPIYYYENTEGGHAGAANAEQRAYSAALMYCYMLSELADG